MDPFDALIDRLELPTKRNPNAEPEAKVLLQNPGFDDGTEDHTHIPYVTIDNENSRDLDQALHVLPTDSGWRVQYALADAAYYIKPGSALFDDALDRGSSYYFPTFALPMLPESLSEGLISLNPDVIRRALVFEIDVDPNGQTVETRVFRAKIRSRAKLSYAGVQSDFDNGWPEEFAWTESMRAFRDVGIALRAAAIERGVIEYDRNEAEIKYDGEKFSFERRERLEIEKWNEQISLLINSEGANLLNRIDREIPNLQSVYRVHLPPLEHRLSELKKTIDAICDLHDLPDSFRWNRKTRLSRYLRELPDEPARIAKTIQLQVRYTNRASEFSDRVGPHFALAVPQYARFSSPMREVVGIFTHKEALEGLGIEAQTDDDPELLQSVISSANDAKKRQKKVDKEVMLMAMRDYLNEDLAKENPPVHVGTVIGLRPTRVYVALDELPIEIKLYVSDLNEHYNSDYELEQAALVADGAPLIRMGDRIAISTAGYDEKRRRFRFSIEA